MLESMLDFSGATAVNKVAGLTDTQALTAAVPPSALTPVTVSKHLAGTERFWFSIDDFATRRFVLANSHVSTIRAPTGHQAWFAAHVPR